VGGGLHAERRIAMLLSFAQFVEDSGFGTAIRESPYAFALIESVHLLALAIIGGAVLLVDLRLLGFGLTKQPLASLARDAWRWQKIALVVLILTGLGLFASEAIKCYYSTPFWVKMSALIAATFFAFVVRRRVIFAPDGTVSPLARNVVAILSMALWFAVGASGRWIGFSG
jgi:hypothetical protein